MDGIARLGWIALLKLVKLMMGKECCEQCTVSMASISTLLRACCTSRCTFSAGITCVHITWVDVWCKVALPV